ncbi:hypothetical protein OROGR_001089 [Orobanche gracilis]
MGCCLSTNPPSKPSQTFKISETTPTISNISKSPPPTHPNPEEETVKEVLSEIRTIPKSPSASPRAQGIRQNESPLIKNAPLPPDFSKVHQNGAVCKTPFTALNSDDVSEDVVSEICSTLGESESASASASVSVSVSTTVTEQREEKNDGESLEQFRQMSPAKRKNSPFSGEVKRDRTVGSSPVRRSEPSPSRPRPRPVSGSGYGRKRDSGEISGRRSRSPVTRTGPGPSKMGPGWSPTTRKSGRSPSRAGSGERIRKVDGARKDGGGNKEPPTSDESLENPLVSLECFIFL